MFIVAIVLLRQPFWEISVEFVRGFSIKLRDRPTGCACVRGRGRVEGGRGRGGGGGGGGWKVEGGDE